MTYLPFLVLAVALLFGALFWAPRYYALFQEYCDLVSLADGSVAERRSGVRFDGGFNFYEIEQYFKIWARSYKNRNNSRVRELGDLLFQLNIIYAILISVFVAMLAVAWQLK